MPVPRSAWTSSLDREAYLAGVHRLRAEIAAGQVYQANLCRVLRAPCPDPDLPALAAALAAGNPAPYAGLVDVPGARVVSASPELFLRREGRRVTSGPIKGTGRTAADLRAKDVAENVMIVDLVRHDLSPSAVTGSVEVPALCALEQHPGLVHLVSTVTSELSPGLGWADLLADAFPPGSVTGAPKSSATRLIAELEPVARGPYCGAVGWVDADTGTGELAVGDPHLLARRRPPAPRASGPGSPGAATRRPSGPRPSSRRPGCSRSRRGRPDGPRGDGARVAGRRPDRHAR